MAKLSQTIVAQRMVEWRNLKRLHKQARKRVRQLEKTVAKQQCQLDQQAERIAELEAIVKKLTDTKHRFRFFLFGEQKQNQSPKGKQRKRKQRRPKKSYQRPKPTDDEITSRQELVLDTCPQCNHEVSTSQDQYTTWVEDIVFAPKTVTEYTVHRHWCRNCSQLVRAPLPNALPGMHIGLNTMIFVLIEHYRAKKTDEQIIESLKRYHKLDLSSGEITLIRHKAAQLFGDQYEEIIQAIRQATVVYGDETVWKILGKSGQCWILTAPEKPTTRYIMADTRGAGVLDEALGKDWQGIMVSDFYSAYDNTGSDQQKCWVHLLRETHLLTRGDPDNQERLQLHTELTRIYAAIIRFKAKVWTRQKSQSTETRLANQLQRLAGVSWVDPECQRIAKRITKYQRQLLTCIRHADVLPENNTAERGLRPVVTHRKITNGNRSDKGAQTYQVNKSVIETFRLEGGDLVTKLRQTLYRSAWKQKLTPEVV
jgi:transposase